MKRKKEFREKGGKKRKRKKRKKRSSSDFKPFRLGLLFVLSVEREVVVGRIGFTFLPSCAILFAVVQPPVLFLRVLLLPTRPLVHQLCCP